MVHSTMGRIPFKIKFFSTATANEEQKKQNKQTTVDTRWDNSSAEQQYPRNVTFDNIVAHKQTK